jgi:hypothetical protein
LFNKFRNTVLDNLKNVNVVTTDTVVSVPAHKEFDMKELMEIDEDKHIDEKMPDNHQPLGKSPLHPSEFEDSEQKKQSQN